MILLLATALASAPIASWDLQQDDGGFTPGGELGQWAWGNVTAGPGSAFDGTRAWAIGLNGAYLNDSVEYLEIPLPDLAGVVRPVFSFEQWYGFGLGDYGYLELDEGAGFHGVTPVYGYPAAQGWAGGSGGWEQSTVLLPNTAVRLRFVFVADLAGVGPGWFIDAPGVWDGDVTAPRVTSLDTLADTEALAEPYAVNAEVADDTHVLSVSLQWHTDTGASGIAVMTNGSADRWLGAIPAQPPGTIVSYYVLATDGANMTTWPAAGERSFRVYLPAPTGLTGPSGRVVATEAVLSWTPPVSAHAVTGYQVLQEEAVVAESVTPEATVALHGDGDTFTVRAVFAEGVGDASVSWSVNSIEPLLLAASPDFGYAGDSLRVELYGDHAQFVEGEVTVDFGAGITTNSVSVRDVDRLVAELTIDPTAMPGERTIRLDSPVGALELAGAFSVGDAAARPQLVSVDPARVTQGESGTLHLSFTGDLAAIPSVDLGPGVVVESVATEGQELVIAYAVAINAAVGQHAITADDGVRRLDGVNLTVRDWSPAPVQTCASSGGDPTAVAGLASMLLAWRRRSRRMS